jgi:hypothetical protein
LVAEGNWQPREEAEVIPETWDEGMPIVEVKMHMLAEPGKRTGDLEHMGQRASHRVLNVGDQVGQPVVDRAELLEIQAGMAVSEPGGRLSQADVADVDAATDSLGGLKTLGHLDEPAAIQPGGVLQKDEGAIGPLTKASIQLAQSGEQAVGLCRHLTLVMDDQPGDAACEAVGEFPHHGMVPPVQHVDATAQVDDRQARMGGHELQDCFELVRRVRVHLGGHAHLGEAETSEPEQRIVSINALLEQGMNVAQTSSSRFHDPHSTAPH